VIVALLPPFTLYYRYRWTLTLRCAVVVCCCCCSVAVGAPTFTRYCTLLRYRTPAVYPLVVDRPTLLRLPHTLPHVVTLPLPRLPVARTFPLIVAVVRLRLLRCYVGPLRLIIPCYPLLLWCTLPRCCICCLQIYVWLLHVTQRLLPDGCLVARLRLRSSARYPRSLLPLLFGTRCCCCRVTVDYPFTVVVVTCYRPRSRYRLFVTTRCYRTTLRC